MNVGIKKVSRGKDQFFYVTVEIPEALNYPSFKLSDKGFKILQERIKKEIEGGSKNYDITIPMY